MSLVCVDRDHSRLEQLELLLFLIVSVDSTWFLSSSQLRYSIKFEFECPLLQHPIISIFGSRFLKIYFLDLIFSRAHISRTLFNIQAGEGSSLDGA